MWGKESALCDMDVHLDSEKVNLCGGGKASVRVHLCVCVGGVNVSVFVCGGVGGECICLGVVSVFVWGW